MTKRSGKRKDSEKMKITIEGTEKEIADLVVLIQNQRMGRKPYSDSFGIIVPDASSDMPDKMPKQS